METALITGVTGQDGALLSDLLLKSNYVVHGIKRRSSLINTDRIDHLYDHPNFHLHYGDLSDAQNITRLIKETEPDEIYNLGAMSHVKVSFELPEYTANIDGLGLLRILEAVRLLGMEKKVKVYQASTSELFGNAPAPQNEETPFQPQSPYACAKLYAYWIAKIYREAYGMFICNGILFNHESELRGETFVTRKITRTVARISLGLQQTLELGNLDAKRDWGFADYYVHGMVTMMQQDKPDDYILATGITTTVREFTRLAFKAAGIDIHFRGNGIKEAGYDENEIPIVKINPKYYRPNEVNELCGDASKAFKKFAWRQTNNVESLVKMMVDHDINEASKLLCHECN